MTHDELEQAIIQAAEHDDVSRDVFIDLLDQAIEQLPEERVDRLFEKVHQILKESVRDIRGWKS